MLLFVGVDCPRFLKEMYPEYHLLLSGGFDNL